MDIKDVKVGGIYYIPVEVISVDDDVQAYYAKRKEKGLWDDFDAVDMVTKDEIISTEVDDRVDFWKRDSESAHEEIRKLQKLLNSKEEGMRKIEEYADQLKKIADDLGDENEKLKQQLDDANELLTDAQAQVKKLTEADCMRVQEFKPIIEERDKARGDLVTAREAIDYLQEENNKLKEEMEGMDIAHKSLCECNFKYSHRLDDQYEVIRALVEKIRRLEKANETVCITKPV